MPDEFDRNSYNTDPKWEKQRTQFDAMVEDSLGRFIAREKAKPKPQQSNFFDDLASFLGFGGGK